MECYIFVEIWTIKWGVKYRTAAGNIMFLSAWSVLVNNATTQGKEPCVRVPVQGLCLVPNLTSLTGHLELFNSLTPGRWSSHFENVIFDLMFQIDIMSSWEIVLMPQNYWLVNSGSGMAWCRQATSHYLSQCLHSYISPYGVTSPQRVKWHLNTSTPWRNLNIGFATSIRFYELRICNTVKY